MLALLEPRASLKELAPLCRRLSLALESGIDLRRVLAREAERPASRGLRRALGVLQQETAQGSTLVDALEHTGSFFPIFFRELADVGEATGRSAEVFRHLADHYEHQQQLRRAFLASLTWPAVQLVAAILIVGLLIWIMGVLGDMPGRQPIDILGFGLVGTRGVTIYFTLVALVVGGGALLVAAMRRGLLWTAPLERALLALPMLGDSLRTLALARLTWTLHLTLEAGMEIRRALALSLRGSRHAPYIATVPAVTAEIKAGREVHEALGHTAAFPHDFLDALEVGEHSGRLPESMAVLSRQYQDRARQALGVLTTLAGFAVWALVALLIILLIFRIFMFYLGTINEALEY